MASEPLAKGLEDDADPIYTHFKHRAEFLSLLERFLSFDVTRESSLRDDESEEGIVASLGAILDYYLPLPGLLDPSLDVIVPPLMEVLSSNLHALAAGNDNGQSITINSKRLARLGRVLNWVVKVRGWKAVVPHFPSSIPNLPMLVTLLSPPTSPSSSTTPSTPHHPLLSSQDAWELRAILLLWLALLLTVPFNLSALSSTSDIQLSTSAYGLDLPSSERLFEIPLAELGRQVALLAIPLLQRPGKEGAYAALVLARLYAREDAVQGLPGFFNWAGAEIAEGDREGEANFVASIFELLTVLPSLLAPRHLILLENFVNDVLLPHLRGSRTAATSGLIRKLAVKAKGRLWLAKLGKGCKGDEENFEASEGLEEQLDDLMGGLSDKDTIVRYSCAKYLARISALLPSSFSSQIVLAIIALFGGTEDEPVVETPFGTIVDPGGSATVGGTMGFGGLETTRGEARWHGVCLALAEMARRGLIDGDAVEDAVSWAVKALTFDLRRASHSIGSNVRDAAAYLVWSLSRACSPDVLASYADKIATALVCVAVFDREVGVRRAASAAFQEGVGRLGSFPEGIDVLAKTDFYSVSVKRIAFTTAAPAVAMHSVYRAQMREHLHHITLRHWDIAMRTQGAAALKSLLELGSDEDVNDSSSREIQELSSLDAVNVHGGLMALGQIASLFKESDPRKQQAFNALSTIRPAALVSQQAADIITAGCELITDTLNESILSTSTSEGVLNRFLDLAVKRRECQVHESLADVYSRLSQLRDPAKDVNKLISDLKSFRISQRQSATLSLGHILYPNRLLADKAVNALDGLPGDLKVDVESRRWAIRSLADIAVQHRADGKDVVASETLRTILKAVVSGLEDYTTDQRGDVGSWVRIQSLKGLGMILSTISRTGESRMIDEDLLELVIGGIIKQSMEKLESIRGSAALALARIKEAQWTWEGVDTVFASTEQLLDDAQGFRYIDQVEWFTAFMPVIKTKFRSKVVGGLTHSIASQIVTLSNAALCPLVNYLKKNATLIQDVLQDISSLLVENFNSNRIFVPALQTIHKLLSSSEVEQGGLIEAIQQDEQSIILLKKIVAVACRGMGGIKSIERITAAMRVVIASLSIIKVRPEIIKYLSLFLAHRFPRIRAMASEELYLALSNTDDDKIDEELEQVILETEWIGEEYQSSAERVVKILSEEEQR